MLTNRQLFFQHIAQTSDSPIALEIERAEGIYLFDTNGKRYMDLISGISVSNIGHRHPKVLKAIHDQLDKYMHLMVYGEYVQSPQTLLAKAITDRLPNDLDSVYFVNSGSEAVEGAMKVAKRYTGRTEIISFKNAYHGSTQGSLSIIGNEEFKTSFRPLLPDTRQLEYNKDSDLEFITDRTAAVFAETIQAESGVLLPENDFLKKLKKRCTDVGALLVLDEIQCGYGRAGTLFAFEQFGIEPDILCIAKGMGGGMPIGAFVSSKKIMSTLTFDPPLGHCTTFGGHPVCCAAAHANLNVILEEKLVDEVLKKGELFYSLLVHPKIKAVRGKGLLLAIEFGTEEENKNIINKCIEKGVITDWFLFNAHSMRIAPPLTITEQEIKEACAVIVSSI